MHIKHRVHIRNSQPYQLHASTHALTGQAFSADKKSTTHQIRPKQTKDLHTNISEVFRSQHIRELISARNHKCNKDWFSDMLFLVSFVTFLRNQWPTTGGYE